MSEGTPLDIELSLAMDAVFEIIKENPANKDTDDQLRLRVTAHNLRALAQVVLIADDNQDMMEVNMKQFALGLLGTSDWILKNIPELDPHVEVPKF